MLESLVSRVNNDQLSLSSIEVETLEAYPFSAGEKPFAHCSYEFFWLQNGEIEQQCHAHDGEIKTTYAKRFKPGDIISIPKNQCEFFTACEGGKGYFFDETYIDSLIKQCPDVAAVLMKSIFSQRKDYDSCAENTLKALRDTNKALDAEIEQLVASSKVTQKQLLAARESELEDLIDAIASMVRKNLVAYAQQEAEETGIGDTESKISKLGFVCDLVLENLTGITTFGRLDPTPSSEAYGSEARADTSKGDVWEYGSPRGTLFAVVPLTNPIPNSLFKILNALRTRNSIILSYPSKASKLGVEFVEQVQNLLKSRGYPKQLVQCVPQPSSREKVQRIMAHKGIDLIFATGGSGLVNAAHSSGNPCFGVGPGNAPVWIESSADLNAAARDIVESKSYDNGIICGSENNIVVEPSVSEEFDRALENHGAAVLNAEELSRAADCWFEDPWRIKREFLGKPASFLAEKAGIKRDFPIRLLVMSVSEDTLEYFGKEKLAPVAAKIISNGINGMALCQKLLALDGAGHTAAIHSTNAEAIDRFATAMPVGRIVVNTPATFGMMGVSTGLPLSFVVGSGSFGKNITTDNISWRHFLNIKRLAFDARE